jgi:F-type H+-transporting ATPase subunit b
VLALLAIAAGGGLAAGAAALQPAHADPQARAQAGPADTKPGEGGHQAEGEHEAASPWGLLGKIFNFAVLAGGLVYLLRSPFARHLENRVVRIRSDLANARQMRDEASSQMVKIEERLEALPAEIDALKRRGASEVAAERVRMREATEAERQRLIDQARREVESQVRTAERMLLKRAGELAVNVATERVRRTITDADQVRLVDRYVAEVGN